MDSATFIFAKGDWDDAFYKLDEQIAAIARSTPGYLGEESWENVGAGLTSNVHYWDTLESLQQLMQHPAHLEAKARQAAWLAGYQVVIAQVLHMYGDGGLGGKLPVTRLA